MINVNGKLTSFLVDTGASLSTLKPTKSTNLKASEETVRAVGVGGIPMCLPVSEPTMVSIGPFTENMSGFTTSHSFLLSDTTPVNLLGRDLLCKLNCTIYCTPDGIFLETNERNKTTVLAALVDQNQPIGEEKGKVHDRVVSSVPPSVWSSSSNDIGLIKTAEPAHILLKQNAPLPRISQYPLSQEKREGIRPIIRSLLNQGIIVPCNSPCNTPILPVKKPGKPEYRFVQDLRAINDVVLPRFPLVPNPTTVLSSIPANSTHYTVLDLCSAFFSVPLHKDSQYLFAFTYEGQQYTFTRLPQGYTESPTIFSRALHNDLKDLSLPGGSTLIQYVDDLLLASPSVDACETDTIVLLKALAEKGHKTSLKKAQLCQKEVLYLGHTLSGSTRVLTPSRIKAIVEMPKPTNMSQMKTFLGMTGYCRQWIIDYASLAAPLQDISKPSICTAPLTWSPQADEAFAKLKQTLLSAPALGLPDYDQTFTLFVHEKCGFAQSVLTQRHNSSHRPVAYFSSRLDPVERGLPPCLKAVAVAAAALAINKSADIVLGSPLTVMIPHDALTLITREAHRHVTGTREAKYVLTLTAPHITLKRCSVLNPATLLSTKDDGDPHNCIDIISCSSKPRPDLSETPISNSELVFYTDGSAYRENGVPCAGYAICDDFSIVESAALPPSSSAQVAELYALMRACHLAKGKTVTIYTDSRYAFGCLHDFGTLWANRGFITSSGTSIKHGKLIGELLDACQLPSSIAVVKCEAHTKSKDPVSRGNALADHAAKAAAKIGIPVLVKLC